MAEIVDVDLADLFVDTRNARLTDEQTNQQTALFALAKQQGKRLLKLATDIVEYGLDPTALPAVVATNDQRRYIVLEGNRRVVTLKALETPSLVAAAFAPTDQKRLLRLSALFAQKPISSLKCVLFGPEEELNHWIDLRHTGQNEGIGLVEWGADEKDRYAARHGQRSPAGQILDFVERAGLLSEAAKHSNTKIITNITRLISSPAVRQKIGIDVSEGQITTLYPASEVAKSLTRMVEDLKTERIKVGDIYKKEDRTEYAKSFALGDTPNPATRLEKPKPLGSKDAEKKADTKPKPKAEPKKEQAERTALIPKGCQLNVVQPRISGIYKELLQLSADDYPNACSVIMRVFLELSVDHYSEKHQIMTDDERRNWRLAKRIKEVAADLKNKGAIGAQLEIAVEKIADSQFILAASTTQFNQYVHNKYIFPKATELKAAWDELQPFMEKLWP